MEATHKPGSYLNKVAMGAAESKQGRKVPSADNCHKQIFANWMQRQLKAYLGLQTPASSQLTPFVEIQSILQLIQRKCHLIQSRSHVIAQKTRIGTGFWYNNKVNYTLISFCLHRSVLFNQHMFFLVH